MKRTREEVHDLVVFSSFRDILDLIPVKEHKKFRRKFAKHIAQDVCNDRLWPKGDVEDHLTDDKFDFYFFKQELATKEDIDRFFVGLANVDRYSHEIKHICSIGYGRKIVEWIDAHYGYPPEWSVEALPQAAVFWHKLGFRFIDEKPKHGQLLMKMASKYGYAQVGDWLEDVDLNDYVGSETYYDVKELMEKIVRNYRTRDELTYDMIRERARPQSKITRYFARTTHR